MIIDIDKLEKVDDNYYRFNIYDQPKFLERWREYCGGDLTGYDLTRCDNIYFSCSSFDLCANIKHDFSKKFIIKN